MVASDGRTQVLVVGAGPVGLTAALRLRRLGIDVRVVDQQASHRAHSFPAVLHAQSSRLLSELGLSPVLFWRGHTVTRLAVYAEHERRAVLDLPKVSGIEGGTLTLPHDVLGSALLNELDLAGVTVEWNTILSMLQQDGRVAWGRLAHDDPRRWPRSTRPELSAFEAAFVIGADGYDSTVRQALGIELVEHGPLQTFAFFDSGSYGPGSEAQLCVSNDFANSVYPLQGGRARFSFQMGRGLHQQADAKALRALLLARTPCFPADTAAFEWGGVVEFRRALAARFGQGRVWLAGDAAHLTGPLGAQSLNAGLDEANELAERISDALARPSSRDFGPAFGERHTQQWRQLLGVTNRVAASAQSPSWVRRHASTLISCLPAAGADLDGLLAQMRLMPAAAG